MLAFKKKGWPFYSAMETLLPNNFARGSRAYNLLRFHRFHVPAAAERPAHSVSCSYPVAAVRPGILTLVPFLLFSLVTLADAMRSSDVSASRDSLLTRMFPVSRDFLLYTSWRLA